MTRPAATRWLGLASLAGLVLALGTGLVSVLRAGQVPVGTPVRRFASPGDYPEGLAWDGARLWVNNFTDGTLAAVDPQDGHVLGAWSGGGLPPKPEGLAFDGTNLWTSNWDPPYVAVVHPTGSTIEFVSTHALPDSAGKPVGLEFDGQHLWMACFGYEIGTKSDLFEIDPTNFSVVKKLHLPVWYVEDLAWDGKRFWSVDWVNTIGFSIDPATGDTANTYRPPGPNPVGMAWDGTYLWISDTTSDSLWALDVSGARPSLVKAVSWSEVKRAYRD